MREARLESNIGILLESGDVLFLEALALPSTSPRLRWQVRADDRTLAPIHDRIIHIPA